MKLHVVATAVGAIVVAGGGAAIAVNAGGARSALPTNVKLVSATGPAALADQAALGYVDHNSAYAGSGTPSILKTEADTEHGIPVYDVLVKAPNGTIYSLSVRTSNDSVLSANKAESQGASGPVPSSSPSNSSPDTHPPSEPQQTREPASTPGHTLASPPQTPEPKQTPEPTTAPQSSATDSQDSVGQQHSNNQPNADN